MTSIKEILETIDEDIRKAYKNEQRSVSVPVPTLFNFPDVTNAEAQREIYYRILVSLLDRHFDAKIKLGTSATVIHIKWRTDEEQNDIDIKNNLIAQYSI